MNLLRQIWHDHASHIIVGIATLVLVTAYFTGLPWVPDTVDPVFHLLRKLYSAMWSNMWAPSLWTLLGIVIADIRHEHRATQVKSHHTENINDLSGQIAALSARLGLLMGECDGDIEQPR